MFTSAQARKRDDARPPRILHCRARRRPALRAPTVHALPGIRGVVLRCCGVRWGEGTEGADRLIEMRTDSLALLRRLWGGPLGLPRNGDRLRSPLLSQVCLGLPLPLTAVQLLYVNLATDGLPALALAVDPHAPDLMRRRPRKAGAGIFTTPVTVLILLGGAWSALVNVSLFAWALASERPLGEAITMAFVSLVLIQFFKAFCFRSERHSILERPFETPFLPADPERKCALVRQRSGTVFANAACKLPDHFHFCRQHGIAERTRRKLVARARQLEQHFLAFALQR